MGGWTKYIFLTLCFFTAKTSATEAATHKMQFKPGRKVGTVQTSMITEASGIVASRKNRPVLWVHNDSGNAAKLFAIDPNGTLLGKYRINNARCRDWEDIAIGRGPETNIDYLYIGDIGDNLGIRGSIIVYRVPEPKVEPNNIVTETNTDRAEAIELIYPDGAKDAETLLVDPLNGDIYIVTKREILCKVYRAAYPQSTQRPTTMSQVAVVPWALAVGGDISTDGKYIIIRSLTHASIWERPKGKPLWQTFSNKPDNVELVYEPQGEAICFDADGRGCFTISEMKKPPIYYFACPVESEKPDQ